MVVQARARAETKHTGGTAPYKWTAAPSGPFAGQKMPHGGVARIIFTLSFTTVLLGGVVNCLKDRPNSEIAGSQEFRMRTAVEHLRTMTTLEVFARLGHLRASPGQRRPTRAPRAQRRPF